MKNSQSKTTYESLPDKKPSMIEIPSAMIWQVQVTAVAGDKTLPDIEIPEYQGKLLAAYLDLIADNYEGAGAGTLDIDQYIQVSPDAGAHYYNAIFIPDNCAPCSGAVTLTNPFIAQGGINIKDYCTTGTTLTVKWTNAKGTTTLSFRDVKLVLKLIFE